LELVEQGNTVVVIEHNMDLVACADWVLDLGPDGGREGGQLVAQGTPEQVAQSPNSHTGPALARSLGLARGQE
jgi:excinuclease ABC subunit A